MSSWKDCKNIVYDKWLSALLHREVYKIIVEESFIETGGGDIIKSLQSKEVFLYSKVPVESVLKIEFLERLNFHLIETNVTLKKSVSSRHEYRGNALVRFACPDDEDQTVELGRRGIVFSRFHLDKNFPFKMANNIKAEWVRSYFTGQRGKYMVVAVVGDSVRGFLQLLQDDTDTLIIDLMAVDRDCRRKGIASDMIAYAEEHCEGVTHVRVGTQIANLPSLSMYEKLGFRIIKANYVFHYHSSTLGGK